MREIELPEKSQIPEEFLRDQACPECGAHAGRVIYYGLPMWLCSGLLCSCLFGFWSFIAGRLPFNGHFFCYDGAYLPALWEWLTGPHDEDPYAF